MKDDGVILSAVCLCFHGFLVKSLLYVCIRIRKLDIINSLFFHVKNVLQFSRGSRGVLEEK